MAPFATYQEFLKLPGSKGNRNPGGYQRYKKWVTTTRSTRSAARNAAQGQQFAATAFGGYHPPGAKQFGQYAKSIYPVQTNAQMQALATKNVNAATQPVIDYILKSLGDRETSALQGIGRATLAHQANLGQVLPAVQNQYNQAKTEQAGIDAALRALPAQQGAGLAAQNAALPSGMAPDVANALGTLAAGSATEQAGLGAATASRLAAQGLAEQAWAAELPGYGRLEGQAAENAARADYRRMREESIGELRSKVPGMVAEQFANLQTRDTAMRTGRASVMQQGWDRMLQAAIAKAGLSQDFASMAQQGSQFSETMGWETDPNNPKNKAGGSGGDTPLDYQKFYNTQLDRAEDLARAWRLGTDKDVMGNPVGVRSSVQATKQMIGFWTQRFPGKAKNKKWLMTQVFNSLKAGGYPNPGVFWRDYIKNLPKTNQKTEPKTRVGKDRPG